MRSSDWKIVVGAALTEIKDELLAGVLPQLINPDWDWHGNFLTERGNPYDYFIENCGLSPESELYNSLRETYEPIVRKASATLQSCTGAYVLFGLEKRLAIVRWVVAQIPIEKWEKQLTSAKFIDEAAQLREIYMQREVNPSAFQEFQEQIVKNQSKPLFPYIEEYRQKVTSHLILSDYQIHDSQN